MAAAGAPPAGGQVELEVGVADRAGVRVDAGRGGGARPRLVCSSTPVALITGRSRAAASDSARARADSGSPAAMASRAASTSRGWGRPMSARLRARASTDGGSHADAAYGPV